MSRLGHGWVVTKVTVYDNHKLATGSDFQPLRDLCLSMKSREPEMTKRFAAAFTAIILMDLIAACTDAGGDAAKTAQPIVGEWKNESITRQGTITAKFSADGTCYFRESGGKELSCNWTAPGDGQTKVAITFPGKSDVSFATAVGDRLFVHEPAREIFFVRDEIQLLGTSVRQLLPSWGPQQSTR